MTVETDVHAIVDILQAAIPDSGTVMLPGTQKEAQAIQAEIVPYLQQSPKHAAIWADFQAHPQDEAALLGLAIGQVLHAHSALAHKLEVLLVAYRQAAQPTGATTITTHSVDTGGAAYVGGNVTLGDHGNFAGRDQVITHHETQANMQVFQDIYRLVDAQAELPVQDKADLKIDLQDIEAELAKGEQAEEAFIQHRLRNIKRMAPDILDVVLTTFANPLAGLGMVAQKIADKMRAEGVQV